MAKVIFTPTYLDSLKCATGQIEEYDGLAKGLSIRVTASKKVWNFTFTPPGAPATKRARKALGTYPATTLKVARERAVEALGQVEAGIDPRTVGDKPAGMTMTGLVKLWEEKHLTPAGRPALRSAGEILRRFEHDVLPIVGKLPVADFRKKHWYEIQDEMENREAFILCNRVFKTTRQMMDFAAARDLCEFNPMAPLDVPFPDEEGTGKRFLTVPEILHLWHSMPKALIRSPKVQQIVRLLLAMGKRSNEVCGAKRSEINWGQRIWTIPAARVKGKDRVKGKEEAAKDEIVPLSDLAYALFEEAARLSNSEFLFPNDDGEGAYQPGVVSKCIRLALEPTDELVLGRLGMAKWTPHDLRRTVGTQMLNRANGLNITKAQKYLALNHKTADADDKEERNAVSDRVYDMNDYLDDKRHAMVAWGNFLAELVGFDAEQREAA